MGLVADGTAYLLQRSAPRTVRYGESLRFAGTDLPPPRLVRVPTRRGFVGVHVYRPFDDHRDHPVYVHLHGGAFVMRFPEMDDFFCRYVVATCDAVVLNVDYDVAPQARYPVAQEQAHDVFAWACSHPAELRADPTRVALGGFSAGGGLAAAAALQARDLGTRQPVMQLLAVPALDVASPVDRHSASMITPRVQRLVRRTYFKDPARRAEPYASPVLAEDLHGLAPAVVVTAQHDVLRDAGDRYARRLREAGNRVGHHVVPGVDHYFLDGGRAQALEVLALIAGSLQDAMGTSPTGPSPLPSAR